MKNQPSSNRFAAVSQILRQGIALGLCTTLLPFAQLDLMAQEPAPPQQSQYPYQDPGDPNAQQQQQQAPPPQYGDQQPYGGQPQYGAPQDSGNGPAGPPPGYGGETAAAYAAQGPQQLEQLVAPIALYPDSLVAQVLAASTYPQQVEEADRWMQQYGHQPPEQLAQSVNQMPWDPSVKALTQFPTVLQQLARSNQWTIALGNAYYNQPADVMAAVQSMRYRAREAGQLRDTPQQVVVEQGPEIVIQPVNPEVVYVPYYNPWVVYGAPVPVYAGFYRPFPPPGLVFGIGIGIGFGIGIGLAAWGHWGWGYHAWAPNWHSNTIIVNNNTYISRSTTVINHGGFGAYNQGFGRGGPQNFHQAAFNARAPLYNGHPMGPANRPALNGGYNRPENNSFNRTAQPGGFNRPGGPATGAYNRPAAPGNYNRPAASPAYNRPAPGGSYNGGARPQYQSAPRAQVAQHAQAAPHGNSHPSAPKGGGGGGEHHGGGGEHKR